MELLGRSDVDPHGLVAALLPEHPGLAAVSPEALRRTAIEALYAGVLRDQRREVAAYLKDTELVLEPGLDYLSMGFLSTEVRERLDQARPPNLAMLRRIEGITPDATLRLMQYVRRRGHYGGASLAS